jgi:hypothetical protein
MSLEERLEVPEAKSRASTSATDSPRVAASSAAPVPVQPRPSARPALRIQGRTVPIMVDFR